MPRVKSDENQEDPAVHPVSGTVRLLRPGHPAFSRLLSFLPGEIAGDRTPLCPFCGAGTEDCTCGRHRRHFDRCASPFYYEDPVKEGILLFKEYGSAESAAFFAERMAEVFLREWGSPYLDGIVPVPMRKEEIRKRGAQPKPAADQGPVRISERAGERRAR